MNQPRLHLNLASEPFRRDRPILAASIALSAVLGLLLIGMITMAVLQRSQAAAARDAIAAIERQIQSVDREQSQINSVLRNPDNAEALGRTVFLNELLNRKAISWTRIFGDLETVLPHNVRVMSVRPQVDNMNRIQLDLFVGSQTTEPVIDMLMRMEASPVFGKTTIVNWLPPSQTEAFYRYRITVNYAQKL